MSTISMTSSQAVLSVRRLSAGCGPRCAGLEPYLRGSQLTWLDPATHPLGDLDLAVSAVRRGTDRERYVDRVLEYTRASGRSFSTFHDRLF